MTKIDIYSGFLGAGKTTLIKKMISECYAGQKLVLIENEFGEIGIDGGFLQDAGVNITEMNSGCICCSLVGDFGKALTQVIADYAPDRIVIEPSGVGKLSDVIAAVQKVADENVVLDCTVAVADASKVKVYMKNFGEFYNNQIETASTIILSRTDAVAQQKLDAAVELLREHNASATIVTTPWDQLTGNQLMEAMQGDAKVSADLAELEKELHHHHGEHCCCGHDHGEHHHHDHEEHHCCGHHDEHHHHDHEEHHCCGHHDEHHHHDHEEHHCCGHHGEHHHHDHEEHHCCGHHDEHHHHDHDEHCSCGHDHDHHDHHADEVFQSWGVETHKKFTMDTIRNALETLDSGACGVVLRAKGIVAAEDGNWIHFDYVPGEINLRTGAAAITGKLCVIGAELKESEIAELFGV
ncbi:MAG: GTP-binding protein [Oscillospiraceae bacterium]|nr:GTP-binding protein [Oscillospiraceae bacterium]